MWRKFWEYVPAGMFLLSLVFLGYLAGSLTTLGDVFPSRYVRDAYRGADALMLRRAYSENLYTSNLWVRARSSQRGVTVHDEKHAQPGFTLYTSGHGAKAILIDMDGRMVHEWQRPYFDVWDESTAIQNPVPERQIYFQKAAALPNGDLLAVYDGVGDTPWGYGMVKLDKDSNVIWKNLDHHFHHDFAIAGDGRIYGLDHQFRKQPLEFNHHLMMPVLEDSLVLLTPDGRTLKEISLLDALERSPYSRQLWRIMHFSLWDPLHTNDVDILDEKTAAALRRKVPVAAAGQVLLSFRELDGGTIALLDVDREEIIWALTGDWKSQHDPDILPNGNILMFDNLGSFGPGGQSRVLEIDPASAGIVWSYVGDVDHPLSSEWRSDQQRLPNGNTLITESNGARLVEIDARGHIVWEFINPVRGRDDDTMVPVVSWASRLEPSSMVGEFRDMLERRMVAVNHPH